MGDKRIRIRQLVLESFQKDFIDRANAVEEREQARKRRKKTSISVENTWHGKGFTKEEVILHVCPCMHNPCAVLSHPNNHIPNEQDLAKLNEARKVREAKVKEKKERLEKAQARRARKAQQDKKDLEDAKKILRRGRGRRSVCDKRLSCHAVELLCLAMGLRDQVYARHGKRAFAAERLENVILVQVHPRHHRGRQRHV